MNEHPNQERVVLHVDFFNTLALTPIEIEVMQYIYELREEFMKAEGTLTPLFLDGLSGNASLTVSETILKKGVAKVGNQIL